MGDIAPLFGGKKTTGVLFDTVEGSRVAARARRQGDAAAGQIREQSNVSAMPIAADDRQRASR